MKALTLALLLNLTLIPAFSAVTAKPTAPERHVTGTISQPVKNGRWYFAASGHAVYCYGPVMTLPQANGDLQKVATFCRDGRAVVPLKE